jgi:hypothetical protein
MRITIFLSGPTKNTNPSSDKQQGNISKRHFSLEQCMPSHLEL